MENQNQRALSFFGVVVSLSERDKLEALRSQFILVRDELVRMTEHGEPSQQEFIDKIHNDLPHIEHIAQEVLWLYINDRVIHVTSNFHLQKKGELSVPEIREVDPAAYLGIEPELWLAI